MIVAEPASSSVFTSLDVQHSAPGCVTVHISAVGENVIAEASFSSPFASSSSSSRDSECESPSCFSPSITSSSPKPFVSIMSRSVSTRSVRCELRRANRSSASTTSRLADPSGSGRASDVPVPSYPSERCEYAPSDPDASAGSASSRATVSDPFGASYSYLAARKPSGTPYPFVDVPGSDDFDHSSMIRASRDDENEPFALTSAMPLAYDEDAPFSVGAYGDSYVGDSYVGDSYVGDSYVGDSYVGDSYVGDSYVGDSYGLVRGLVRGGARSRAVGGGARRRVFKLGRGIHLGVPRKRVAVPLARSRESALGFARAFDRRRVRDVVVHALGVHLESHLLVWSERGQVGRERAVHRHAERRHDVASVAAGGSDGRDEEWCAVHAALGAHAHGGGNGGRDGERDAREILELHRLHNPRHARDGRDACARDGEGSGEGESR